MNSNRVSDCWDQLLSPTRLRARGRGGQAQSRRPTCREKRLSPTTICPVSLSQEHDRLNDEYGERVLSDGTTKIYDPKNENA